MDKETFIFGGQKRLNHKWRDFGKMQVTPVLLGPTADLR